MWLCDCRIDYLIKIFRPCTGFIIISWMQFFIYSKLVRYGKKKKKKKKFNVEAYGICKWKKVS